MQRVRDLSVPGPGTSSVISRPCQTASVESTTPPNRVWHKHATTTLVQAMSQVRDTHTAIVAVLSKHFQATHGRLMADRVLTG